MTDPIGLALENFDGVGRHRLRENDVLIDPSGDLDGVEFADAKGLAAIISESEVFTKCFVNQLGRYANGRVAVEGEEPGYEHLTKRFVRKNYRVQSLMREMVMSPTFRTIGGWSNGEGFESAHATSGSLSRCRRECGAASARSLSQQQRYGVRSGFKFSKTLWFVFWGNGVRPDLWVPNGVRTEWELSPLMAELADHKDLISVISGLSVLLPNDYPHWTGAAGILGGRKCLDEENSTFHHPTIDQVIAAEIGGDTRFSLD